MIVGRTGHGRECHSGCCCKRELYEVCQRGLGQSVYMAVDQAASADSSEKRVLLHQPDGVQAISS